MHERLESFYQMSAREIAGIIANLPASVTNLNLSNIYLGYKTTPELAQVFSTIPLSVTSLDLKWNNLDKKSGGELALVFSTAPTSVTSLNLGGNNLNNQAGAELAEFFSGFPVSVTNLDLHDNELGNKTTAEITQALIAIPKSVISLNLSYNCFFKKTGAELARVFATIKAINLELSLNSLGNKPADELIEAFKALSASVTNLDLSYNQLGNKTTDELTQIFAALPRSVTSLDLGHNSINPEQLNAIIKALPVNHKIINIAEILAEHLIPKIENLCAKKGIEQLKFHTLQLAIEIDESYLSQLIEVLEKQNNPLANLTCGLLLEGQIATTAERIDNCSDFDDYMEKRTHDAISFYTKAAAGKAIKPIVEFLLWDMKTVNPIFSVQNRLSQYDLNPENIFETLNKTSKIRSAVTLPLFAQLSFFNSAAGSECIEEFEVEEKLEF